MTGDGEPIIFTHKAEAESERYAKPDQLAEFEVVLLANGTPLAKSRDPKLWARVLVLLLTASDERER